MPSGVLRRPAAAGGKEHQEISFIVMAYLAPNDLADLRASGLNDDTIREAGFYTESDPVKIS